SRVNGGAAGQQGPGLGPAALVLQQAEPRGGGAGGRARHGGGEETPAPRAVAPQGMAAGGGRAAAVGAGGGGGGGPGRGGGGGWGRGEGAGRAGRSPRADPAPGARVVPPAGPPLPPADWLAERVLCSRAAVPPAA